MPNYDAGKLEEYREYLGLLGPLRLEIGWVASVAKQGGLRGVGFPRREAAM